MYWFEEKGWVPDEEESYGNIVLILDYEDADSPATVYHKTLRISVPYDEAVQYSAIKDYALEGGEYRFLIDMKDIASEAGDIANISEWSLGKIFDFVEARGLNIDYFAEDYAEPGYSLSHEKSGILFADWNPFEDKLGKGFMDRLEQMYDLEWSDEWIINHDGNQKAYRSIQDSYGWQPYFVMSDSGIIGVDEIEDDIDLFIDYVLPENINNPKSAVNIGSDIEKLMKDAGYELVTDENYESGMHPHQTDNPEKILAEALSEEPDGEFVFTIPYVGQFDINFNLWRKKS